MPTNLTGSTIASTYPQLLHVDGGPTATEKVVYSATGVATALKLGTLSASVDNIRFDGNTVSAITGNLTLGSAIAFASASNARTALGLGTIATQNANAVAITGGSIAGVTFSGSFSGMTLVEATTLATGATAAGVNLNGNTLGADGTDTNIDINITPKGTGEVNIPKVDIDAGTIDGVTLGTTSAVTEAQIDNLNINGNTVSSTNTNGDINITPNGIGEVNVTNIDILSGKVPFSTITNRAYGQFISTQDQTAAANTPTAVTFDTSAALNTGVTVASSSQITFAAAGVYDVYFNIQLINAENADHEVTFWLRLNGADIANSATRLVVPASSVGGTGFFAFNTILSVTAGQYVQVYWATEDADVSLNYEAAEPSTPFARPAIPSAVLTANRVG